VPGEPREVVDMLNLSYNLVNSSDEGLIQPSDEDSQGDAIKRGTPSRQTKTKKSPHPCPKANRNKKRNMMAILIRSAISPYGRSPFAFPPIIHHVSDSLIGPGACP
jgi:hypothetical protein